MSFRNLPPKVLFPVVDRFFPPVATGILLGLPNGSGENAPVRDLREGAEADRQGQPAFVRG